MKPPVMGDHTLGVDSRVPLVRLQEQEASSPSAFSSSPSANPGLALLSDLSVGMTRTQSTSALRVLRKRENRFSFYEDQSKYRSV